MAYKHYQSSWKAKESSEVFFSENEMPTAGNNYSLCKVQVYMWLWTNEHPDIHLLETDHKLRQIYLPLVQDHR